MLRGMIVVITAIMNATQNHAHISHPEPTAIPSPHITNWTSRGL